jgi:hypothetical protein
MFFRRRAPESVRVAEGIAKFLNVLLRWLSALVLGIMIASLALNFDIELVKHQLLPSAGLLLVINTIFTGMHLFFRNLRRYYEAEAEEQLDNARLLIRKR